MRKVILIAILSFISLEAYSQTSKVRQVEYVVSSVSLDKNMRSLTVKLAIINNSRQTIALDKNGLLYSTEFARLGKRFGNGGMTNGEARVSTADQAHPYSGDYVLVKPKDSIEIEHTFHLDDAFFQSDRNYTFSATYGYFSNSVYEGKRVWKGTLKSNEIKFAL